MNIGYSFSLMTYLSLFLMLLVVFLLGYVVFRDIKQSCKDKKFVNLFFAIIFAVVMLWFFQRLALQFIIPRTALWAQVDGDFWYRGERVFALKKESISASFIQANKKDVSNIHLVFCLNADENTSKDVAEFVCSKEKGCKKVYFFDLKKKPSTEALNLCQIKN